MPPDNSDDIYNKDELEAPPFLNNEFFTEVLRKSEKSENLTVKSVKLTPASQKGDHYASIMFRANVEYEQKAVIQNKSIIIKTMPFSDGHKKEMLRESYIFETEIGMYTEVLPKFEKILKDIGDDSVLAAPVLYHSLNPYKVIIFEDIVPKGFAVIRDRALSDEEVKAAYAKLAKWHAVSYKLIAEQPEYFDQYHHSFWNMPNMLEHEFLTGGVELFLELLHKQPSLNEYLPHFEAIQKDLLKNTAKGCNEYRENPKPGAYYVLCHGDFHGKNMMFKHNAKTRKFEDVMLLDFQISHVGTIIYDLMYSQYMLMNAEQRSKSEEFIYFYFNIFTTILRKIGFKGEQPKLLELRKQWLDHKAFDVFLMASFLPMWEAMKDSGNEPEEILTNMDCRRKLYSNERYIEEIHRILPKFLHLGYFDS